MKPCVLGCTCISKLILLGDLTQGKRLSYKAHDVVDLLGDTILMTQFWVDYKWIGTPLSLVL
jgi:hypothetical protein